LIAFGAASTRSLASLRPEFGLLGGRLGDLAAPGHGGHGDRRRGRNAPDLLELLGKLGGLDHSELRELINQFIQISHFSSIS
jgi:hypothetical protein